MYSRIIKFALILMLVPSIFGAGLGYAIVNYLEIPDVKQLETYRPKSTTKLYADDGTLFAELYVEKRTPIPITEMPRHLKLAFVAIEDVRFYRHFGVDIRSIGRAAYRNIIKQGLTEGASTITQQLARNLYLTPQKTFKRKLEEAALAIQIERTYSKDEILNMYLNLIYLGEGAHGVEAAAYTYFHKKARDLNVEESAMLAALTKSPSRLSPYKNAPRTVERRNIVLMKMYEAGFIDKTTYSTAVQKPLALAPFKAYEKRTGYFTDFVKQTLEGHVEHAQDVFISGFNVQTTMNLQMTQYAYEAIEKGMEAYRKRRPNATELPEVALVAIEVKTGEIKVLVGGRDFTRTPFNRAVQAKRQPGSAFKPIIYLTALEQGYTPESILLDSPLSYTNPYTKVVWNPKNYRNEYHGDVTMRRALELSLNTATVRLLEQVGLDNIIDMAKHLHITSRFERNLSLGLGTTEIAPIELAAAYTAFGRGGAYIPPSSVRTIKTIDGEERYRMRAIEEPVVTPEVAFTLVNIMKGVISNGTARSASRMPYYLAGKTGTTDDFRDAWFIGFSPNLLCAVWVGYDKNTNLGAGESGGTTALPIWIDFMTKALPFYPNIDFPPARVDYLP